MSESTTVSPMWYTRAEGNVLIQLTVYFIATGDIEAAGKRVG
jgi:hypothetical protein